MRCPKCGTELPDRAKFCSKCGFKIEIANEHKQSTNEDINQSDTNDTQRIDVAHSHNDDIKSTQSNFWSKMSLFSKIALISMVIVIILMIVAIFTKNIVAIIFSILQLSGLIISILMNKGTIKLQKSWIKYIVLIASIAFCVLNIMSYSWRKGIKSPAEAQSDISDSLNSDVTSVDVSVPFNSIECLDKDCSSVEQDLSAAGFLNIKAEMIEDLQSTETDKVNKIESISINGKTDFKQGDKFKINDEIIIRYHAYAKCNVRVKIEFPSNLILNKYDVKFLVNGVDNGTMKHGSGKEYEFELEPNEYTLVFESAEDSAVRGEVKLVVDCDVEASYEISCFSDKIDIETVYVDKSVELSSNEVKIDVAASEYRTKNYEEVKSALEKLGFTNIKFEVLYDIVFGITENGSVESISIAGNKDFRRGDVFAKDAEIVISYHMPEDIDPNKITMPKSDTDYIGKNYLEVQQELKNLGFTNIAVDKYATDDVSHIDGEVYSVEVNNQSFKKGDTINPNKEVNIKYYAVKTPITVDNNADFAALMKITDQTDGTKIKQLITPLIDNVVEFDGCIAFMMNHNNYKTRFDVCLAGVDYDAERVYGPLFSFEDVSFYDMNVSGTDTVAQGMNFHITAKVKGFNDEGNYVILEPVSLVAR